MTILETSTNSNGHKVRLQERKGRFDVLYNSTGYCWQYKAKGVSKEEALKQLEEHAQ